MKQHVFYGMVILGAAFAGAACGGGEGGAGGGGGTSSSSSSSSGTTSSSSSSSSSGTSSSSSSSSSSGTSSSSSSSSSSGTTSSSSSSSSSSGGGTVDHLVISEVCVTPNQKEFVEIYNAGAAAVDLSNYYLSDNALYHLIATNKPFTPMLATMGSDFLVRFPAGASIAAGGTVVVALSPEYASANGFNKCPDFIVSASGTDLTCTGGSAKAMAIPTNGAVGATATLSNGREMLILFNWDGAAAKVSDVDYVTWGAPADFDAETRVDKTGIGSVPNAYLPDTARDMQKPAPAPAASGSSIERCAFETGEKLTGGNGITGHDETSEPMDTTFVVQATPTPGVKNACLP